MADEKMEGGQQIFIMGLLSIVLCQLLGPMAWSQGNAYMRYCAISEVKPDGMAVAGRIMGMIGTFFLVLNLGLVCLGVCLGVATSGM
jgi:hypothetical protein